METFKNQTLIFAFLVFIPYVCSPEIPILLRLPFVKDMQTNRLKQALRPHRGESPLASFFTLTGKIGVRGDGRIFSNNQTNLLLCVQLRTPYNTKRLQYLNILLSKTLPLLKRI